MLHANTTLRMMEHPYDGTAHEPEKSGHKHLSKREQEVLNLLAKGNSYKMIADEMGIANSTVPTFIKRLYGKLRVHSAMEAIAKVYLGKQ